VTSSLGGSGTRYSFVPPSSETHTYDADGNLTADGRWSYIWDAENRLVAMETVSGAYAVGVPRQLIQFKYDYLGRRVRKTVSAWGGSAYVASLDRKFIYNGWNLLAEYAVPSSGVSPLASAYIWGLDLSGNLVDGGGVGGLLAIKDVTNSAWHLPYYDANGNLHALADRASGTLTAAYEYSPFGETLRATGAYAAANPFRFSTKYTDAETQLLYYGYRYYNPSLGRWLGRDPLGEKGGVHLYAFCRNNGINAYDRLGMIPLKMDDIWDEDMPDADFVAQYQPTWQKVGDSAWYDPVTGIQRNYKGHSEKYYNSLVEGCPDGVQGGTTSLSFLDQINSAFSWSSSFNQQVVVAAINAVRAGTVIVGQFMDTGKTAASGTNSSIDTTASHNNAAGSSGSTSSATSGSGTLSPQNAGSTGSAARFTVTVNSRQADIPGGATLGAIGINHEWISTSTGISAGMGTAQGVPQSDAPFIRTFVVDHTGQVPTSTQIYTGVDQSALMTYLHVGDSTGRWVPGINDCNTWVDTVIRESTPHNVTVTVINDAGGVETLTLATNVVRYYDGTLHEAK
jgi:RHS repeat-associated protein